MTPSTTSTTTAPPTVWALGDYPTVVVDLVHDLGPRLVEASPVGSGQRVLDVAAGTGNVAIPAALTGADVAACDLEPRLLDAGRRTADERGATVDWRLADAQALPYDDDSFDVVLSCIGVMFAPRHEASAAELLRVCRPGGTIGLLNWTPEGFIGQMFATMRPFAPPPPPGAQPPPLWGREDHVRGLLGDRAEILDARRETLTIDHFATPAAFREYFKERYGPTIAVYRHLAQDIDDIHDIDTTSDRAPELDAALDDLARRHDRGDGVMEWEYLVVTARRQG